MNKHLFIYVLVFICSYILGIYLYNPKKTNAVMIKEGTWVLERYEKDIGDIYYVLAHTTISFDRDLSTKYCEKAAKHNSKYKSITTCLYSAFNKIDKTDKKLYTTFIKMQMNNLAGISNMYRKLSYLNPYMSNDYMKANTYYRNEYNMIKAKL